MMRCDWWLSLAMLAGCVGIEDPPFRLPTRPLSQLPAPRVDVVANASKVFVGFKVDAFATGACPVLDDDFRATVNDVAIPIVARGASVEAEVPGDGCKWPVLQLDNPPLAPASVIQMGFSGSGIRIDLGDLLAMRSVQPVPDGPWMFTPGQDITLQWSPKEDLANYVPSICFTPDAPSSTGSTCATFTIAGDRITFALPGVKSPGRLDISLQGDGDWLPCSGARCQLSNTPQFTHPIAWRLPGQGSSSASSAP
jgi:hypothetical protein